ncbi:translation initiation factor SUI1, partial [Entophlyctis helioformis]
MRRPWRPVRDLPIRRPARLAQTPTMAEVETPYTGPSTRVLGVLYCSNCRMPPEYCEFGSSAGECKAWLKMSAPDMYERLYPEPAQEAVEGQLASLTVADGAAAPESAAPAAPAPAKQGRKAAAPPAKKVLITTIERTKRKRVTVIAGLDKFDVDLKKASKLFATKYACGASVTKNAQGADEIVVQGEFADDIFELISETWPAIDEDSIDFGETKKK